jgi:hypothetical protein
MCEHGGREVMVRRMTPRRTGNVSGLDDVVVLQPRVRRRSATGCRTIHGTRGALMSLIGLNTLGLWVTEAQPSPAGAPSPQGRDAAADLRTRDRLVELHVLAEHGDAAAAAEAGEWLDVDPDARQVWHQVEAHCHELRAGARSVGGMSPGIGLPDDDPRDVAPAG